MEMDKILATDLLKKAYSASLSLDMRQYKEYMTEAAEIVEKLHGDSEAYRQLQGEMLLVSLVECINDFDELSARVEKAFRLLGKQRSAILPEGAELFRGFYNVFALCCSRPGHAEEYQQKLSETEALFFRMTGGGRGSALCCKAQLAFFRGNFDEAQKAAKEALDLSQISGHTMVSLCAADTLMRIAVHCRNIPLWNSSYAYIKSLACGDEPAAPQIRQSAQVIMYNMDLSIGMLQSVPDWLRSGDFGVISAPWGYESVGDRIPVGIFGNALLTRIEYLSYSGLPVTALAVSDLAEKVYMLGSTISSAYLAFLRAGCYMQLNDIERLKEQLDIGISLIAEDELWLLASEFAPAFTGLLYEAAADVNSAASEFIEEYGKDYWQKLSAIRLEITKDAQAELSAREREVASLLMEGRKNSEIAELLHISIRTVRTHLENIYRKRGINRRTQLPGSLRHDSVKVASWAASNEQGK